MPFVFDKSKNRKPITICTHTLIINTNLIHEYSRTISLQVSGIDFPDEATTQGLYFGNFNLYKSINPSDISDSSITSLRIIWPPVSNISSKTFSLVIAGTFYIDVNGFYNDNLRENLIQQMEYENSETRTLTMSMSINITKPSYSFEVQYRGMFMLELLS